MSRNIFGWSLPPGVTNKMIEDAAGGDAQSEAFVEAFFDEYARLFGQTAVHANEGKLNTLSEWCWDQISKSYGDGYQQGMSDEGHARDQEREPWPKGES